MAVQRWLHKMSFWFRVLFHRREADQALDDELQFHLDAKTKENIAQGMTPQEAKRAAKIDLGGVEQAKERVRAARTGAWLETLVQDVRFGLRMLRKSPGFTAIAVLTLALGIGANTAIFTLLNAVLYRELPVPHPKQLVQLRVLFHTGRSASLSLPMFQALDRNQEVFSEIFAWAGTPANVEVDGNLTRDNVFYVSGGFYSELGERPLLGRLIEPADTNPDAPVSRVAVISYGFWKSRFAGNPAVLGKQILLENQPFTIIGVTQQEFTGIIRGSSQDITIPFTAIGVVLKVPFPMTSGHLLWLNIFGRLKPRISIAQARGQLSGIWPGILADTIPADETGERREQYLSMRLIVSSAARGPDWVQLSQYGRPLYYLMGMVALILLAVCVNLASLMIARGAGRMQETGVRLALGATPWRIARQTLVEGLLLSAAGALFGLAFGFWGARLIFALLTRALSEPIVLNLSPDFHVLAFTAGIAAATAMLFGLVPALHASTLHPSALMRQDSHVFGTRRSRVGQALIVTQVALSVVLVLASALLTRSLWNLRSVTVGFNRASVLNLWLIERPGAPKNLDVNTYYRQLTNRLDSLPAVRATGLADFVPGGGQTPRIDNVTSASAPGISKGPMCDISFATPGFFHAVGMTILTGRDFAWADGPHQPRVAVISSSLADRLFGDGNAIGTHVRVGTVPDYQNLEIVGVVNDARLYDLTNAHPLNIFLNPLQYGFLQQSSTDFLFVRAAKNPLGLATGISHVIDSFGYQFVARTATLEEVQTQALIDERLSAMISSLCAGFALLLACMGLYGLIAQSVTRRTREIAIRMAIGAQPRNIRRLFLRQAFVLVLSGIVLGVLCSLATDRLVATMLYGVSPDDAASIIGASLILVAVGLLAGYVPARRAMNINPMTALRHE